MEKIETLSTYRGREVLRETFHELRYQRQSGSVATLLICWRLCVYERDLQKYVNKNIQIIHRLGLIRGTFLWLEEVVNRFYYSSINSFVYFGAAILLVLIGVRRFSDRISDTVVIGGIIFEACMLLFMFMVMLFSPNDETTLQAEDTDSDKDDIINEIGEISREFAATTYKIEQIADTMSAISGKNDELLQKLGDIALGISNSSNPNPEMLDIMRQTNAHLVEFGENIAKLNRSVNTIVEQEIERQVRMEVERILLDRINKA